MHKEGLRESAKRYREEHKEELSKKNREYREKNRESLIEKSRRQYAENRDRRIESARKWRIANGERIKATRRLRAERDRELWLKNHFGITLADYDAMLERQGGGCAICGCRRSKNGKRLAVDHCHVTGDVRGLLCDNCNRGLGYFGDNSERLTKAAEYLTNARRSNYG
jgi:hypothetical protein